MCAALPRLQARLKQQQQPATKPPAAPAGYPPVRSGAATKVGPTAAPSTTAPAAPQAQPKPDSKFGGQVRSGKQYYEKWEEFANKALVEEVEEDKPATATTTATGTTNGTTSSLGSGPQLTQRLIELNVASLTEEERAWNAEQEKVKGNESFRAHEYAQASKPAPLCRPAAAPLCSMLRKPWWAAAHPTLVARALHPLPKPMAAASTEGPLPGGACLGQAPHEGKPALDRPLPGAASAVTHRRLSFTPPAWAWCPTTPACAPTARPPTSSCGCGPRRWWTAMRCLQWSPAT